VRHWFDGLAMLHRFAFADGRVTYANRFLRSRAFEAAQRDGRLEFREFATDPCRSAFKRISTLFDAHGQFTDNGAVNVTRLGDQYLALTETPLPVAFDARTLETLGVRGEPPADISTAHPTTTRPAASSSATASSWAPAPPTCSTPSATSRTAASWRGSESAGPPTSTRSASPRATR
jgi:carotenoid cleavage dioxygenase-like enzyme